MTRKQHFGNRPGLTPEMTKLRGWIRGDFIPRFFFNMQHGRRYRELDRRLFLLGGIKVKMEDIVENEWPESELENIKAALEEVERHLNGEIQLQKALDFLAELEESSE